MITVCRGASIFLLILPAREIRAGALLSRAARFDVVGIMGRSAVLRRGSPRPPPFPEPICIADRTCSKTYDRMGNLMRHLYNALGARILSLVIVGDVKTYLGRVWAEKVNTFVSPERGRDGRPSVKHM